jgi:hypothetical protein
VIGVHEFRDAEIASKAAVKRISRTCVGRPHLALSEITSKAIPEDVRGAITEDTIRRPHLFLEEVAHLESQSEKGQ